MRISFQTPRLGSEGSKNFLSFSALTLGLLLVVFYLLSEYRALGTGGLGTYIDSGSLEIHHNNPYVDGARWGSVAPIFLFSLSRICPNHYLAPILQITTMASIWVFIYIFFPGFNSQKKMCLLVISLVGASTRELLNDNQVTGIVIGVFALGVAITQKTRNSRFERTYRYISAFFFAMSLDLKPHIAALFFLSFVVYKQDQKTLWRTLGVFVISHVCVDVWVGHFLELSWIKNLTSLSISTGGSGSPETLTLWPLLRYIGIGGGIVTVISWTSTITIAVVALTLAYRKNWRWAIFLSFMFPACSVYSHFYDLVPFGILVIALVIENDLGLWNGLALSFWLIPQEYRNIRNLLFVVIVFLTISLIKNRGSVTNSRCNLIKFWIGLIISFGVHGLNTRLHLPSHQNWSLIVTECLFFVSVQYSTTSQKFFMSAQ